MINYIWDDLFNSDAHVFLFPLSTQNLFESTILIQYGVSY